MRRPIWISSRTEALNERRPATPASAPHDYFATTRWTVVLAAGRGSTPQAEQALEELCRTYWYPLYAYIRRQGRTREDAEDLTQSFFARLLEKNYLQDLRSEKGKFRAFLLAALKHFLANEWDRANRKKRGGDATLLSLDWQDAETRYQIEPADRLSPDKLYDRMWAVALLERVITRLRDESVAEDKSRLFEELRPFLMIGKSAIPYEQAATALGLNEGAVRVAVHRLRRRYRELLREEIGQTLSNADQVEEEMQALFRAFAAE
jgi:RNA polymerase sigma factor (sigma-70 family)